jgi:hypothetical protein
MKVLKFTLLLAGCTFISTTFAQTLKPKQVPLANWNDDQGMMSYTYYEDPKTGDYIPHGKFSYKLAQGTYYKEDATGSLKNGKRDGVWLYKITRLDDLAFDVNWTGAIQLSFGYKEGKPNGLWTYSNIQKYRTKSRGAWLPYEFQFAPNETLSVMFTDGHPSGIYSYANNSFSTKEKKTGQFNAKGFLHGNWLLSSSDEQTEMVFNNGILVKKVVRDMPSGKVSDSYIASEDELKLQAAFFAKTLTKEQIIKNRIKIDTVSSDDYIVCDERKTLYNKYFNWDNIGGDDLFDKNRGGDLGGKAIDFELIELVELEEIEGFDEKILRYSDKKYFNNLDDTVRFQTDYDEFYTLNKMSLSDDDLIKLNGLKATIMATLREAGFENDLKKYNFQPEANFKANDSGEPMDAFIKSNGSTYKYKMNNYLKMLSIYEGNPIRIQKINELWENGVQAIYCDSSRFARVNYKLQKDYEKELPYVHPKIKPYFETLAIKYYLPKAESLINAKKYCELNELADKYRLVLDKLIAISDHQKISCDLFRQKMKERGDSSYETNLIKALSEISDIDALVEFILNSRSDQC